MIAVIGVFGILLLVGTAADTILNIMHLDIVPDSFLKVNESLHNNLDNDQSVICFRYFKGFLSTVTH